MTINEAKQIKIADYLQSLGYTLYILIEKCANIPVEKCATIE